MKLNICCGMDYRDGYINIDFSDVGSNSNPIKVDVKCNVLEGLPYETCSVDEIVFRESMEHFNRWNALKILQEIFRVLKIGGRLDLTVPPAKKQLQLLLLQMNNDKNLTITDFFKAHEKFSIWKYVDDLAGATHESDGMDGDSHKSFWTPNMLRVVLDYVGFKIDSINEEIQVYATK